MYSDVKELIDLHDDTRKIEIKQYTADGRIHSVVLNRLLVIISEKGVAISDEDAYGLCIIQIDKYHQILSSIERRNDGYYSANVFTYDKKILLSSISCMIMPSNGELHFMISENKYDEDERLTEQIEQAASRVGGKCFSEMRTVFEYRSYGVFEKSWDFSGVISEDGSQKVRRQHNIAGDRYSGRRYNYEPGKGPIERFDEFEDEESLGYIVKIKRQSAITFCIYKNSWKNPTVKYDKPKR